MVPNRSRGVVKPKSAPIERVSIERRLIERRSIISKAPFHNHFGVKSLEQVLFLFFSVDANTFCFFICNFYSDYQETNMIYKKIKLHIIRW